MSDEIQILHPSPFSPRYGLSYPDFMKVSAILYSEKQAGKKLESLRSGQETTNEILEELNIKAFYLETWVEEIAKEGRLTNELLSGLIKLVRRGEELLFDINREVALVNINLEHIRQKIDELVKLNENPEKTWAFEQYAIACKLIGTGQFSKAKKFINNAIDGYSNHTGYPVASEFHMKLGNLKLGSIIDYESVEGIDIPGAFESFKRALDYSEHPEERSDALLMLSYCSFLEKKYEDSINLIGKSVIENSKNARAYYLAAKLASLSDDDDWFAHSFASVLLNDYSMFGQIIIDVEMIEKKVLIDKIVKNHKKKYIDVAKRGLVSYRSAIEEIVSSLEKADIYRNMDRQILETDIAEIKSYEFLIINDIVRKVFYIDLNSQSYLYGGEEQLAELKSNINGAINVLDRGLGEGIVGSESMYDIKKGELLKENYDNMDSAREMNSVVHGIIAGIITISSIFNLDKIGLIFSLLILTALSFCVFYVGIYMKYQSVKYDINEGSENDKVASSEYLAANKENTLSSIRAYEECAFKSIEECLATTAKDLVG